MYGKLRAFLFAYIDWLTGDNVSGRKAHSPRLLRIIESCSPFAVHYIPKGANAKAELLRHAVHEWKPLVITDIRRASSKVHLTADLWTSETGLPALGVNAHYLNSEYDLRTVLLGLREISGSHTGENIAGVLASVIKEYDFPDLLGYFVLDNASNNDTALSALADHEGASVSPSEQRLRCAGHIINLVVKAMLFGTDKDSFAHVLEAMAIDDSHSGASRARRGKRARTKSVKEADEQVQDLEDLLKTSDLEKKLKKWRKYGALGKLHNVVIHIKWTPQRKQFFEAQQRKVQRTEPLYVIVADSGIRWNSTYDMIERALQLKEAIILYLAHYKDMAQDEDDPHNVADDYLTHDDWTVLEEVLRLLEPMKKATKRLEGSATTGKFGALWEVLLAMEGILTHLEERKDAVASLPASHLKAMIYLGWKKLDEYYELTDESKAYRAAVALHPCFRLRWFQKCWGHRKDWLTKAEKVVKDLYNEYSNQSSSSVSTPCHPSSSSLSESSDIVDRMMQLSDDEGQSTNRSEWDAFFDKKPETDKCYINNPLLWWKERAQDFPVLSKIAFDLFSIPAMSSECERTFSKAGNVLSSERPRLTAEVGESQLIIASWIAQNIRSQEVVASLMTRVEKNVAEESDNAY